MYSREVHSAKKKDIIPLCCFSLILKQTICPDIRGLYEQTYHANVEQKSRFFSRCKQKYPVTGAISVCKLESNCLSSTKTPKTFTFIIWSLPVNPGVPDLLIRDRQYSVIRAKQLIILHNKQCKHLKLVFENNTTWTLQQVESFAELRVSFLSHTQPSYHALRVLIVLGTAYSTAWY